jgi:hypothetical protein
LKRLAMSARRNMQFVSRRPGISDGSRRLAKYEPSQEKYTPSRTPKP